MKLEKIPSQLRVIGAVNFCWHHNYIFGSRCRCDMGYAKLGVIIGIIAIAIASAGLYVNSVIATVP